jgi:hypothetical protein
MRYSAAQIIAKLPDGNGNAGSRPILVRAACNSMKAAVASGLETSRSDAGALLLLIGSLPLKRFACLSRLRAPHV